MFKISKLFKKICVILMTCILMTHFLGCSFNASVPIHSTVKTMLAKNDIKKSKITYLKDFSKSKINYDKERISFQKSTDEEFKDYIDTLISSHEEIIEITDRTVVQTDDVVIVDYFVRHNSLIVSEFESVPIMVGRGKYDIELENAIIGSTKNKPFICEIRASNSTEEYRSGDILQYEITVNSINYFKTYSTTDPYILQYYGFESEEDFLKDCKFRFVQQKTADIKNKVDNEFLNALVGECRFYIDKKEIADYSKKIVEDYTMLSDISGLSLDEYIEQVLKITEEEFYELCYKEGEQEVKQHLLVGAFCANMENVFDGESYVEFCSMNGYDSTEEDNTRAKYAFLKDVCVNSVAHIEFIDYLVGYGARLNDNVEYSVKFYNTSNIYNLNLAETGTTVSSDVAKKIISEVNKIEFGETAYCYGGNLYDCVLTFDMRNENAIKLMIDRKNRIVTMRMYEPKEEYPYIVKAQLTEELVSLIEKI